MIVWQPLGFGNVFHYPSLTPVTPQTIKVLEVRHHLVEFHQQLFSAIVVRNGISREQVAAGYWILAGGEMLTDEQHAWYRSQGVPI